MKTLLIVRHAKSSWDAITQPDMERPLNDRGKKDAADMAARLRDRDLAIDHFVSSPAKRAKKTAKYFAEAYKTDKDKIELVERLYEPTVEAFYTTIMQLPDSHKSVALFAHNPGITEFVNTLTAVRIDDMPTGAVYAIKIDTPTWTGFREAAKSFLFFDYPKNPLG